MGDSTITYNDNRTRITGNITQTTPLAHTIQGAHGPVLVPVRFVSHIIHDDTPSRHD